MTAPTSTAPAPFIDKAGPSCPFIRALAFGSFAAAFGAGIYYLIGALTGYEFGIIAIVIGFMVGTAVRAGSNDRGDLRFQLLAIFLTYTAIVSTYVPALITGEAHPSSGVAVSQADAGGGTVEAGSAEDRSVHLGHAVLRALFLIAVVYALPFLAGPQNLIGLLILSFGVFEAWRIAKEGRGFLGQT